MKKSIITLACSALCWSAGALAEPEQYELNLEFNVIDKTATSAGCEITRFPHIVLPDVHDDNSAMSRFYLTVECSDTSKDINIFFDHASLTPGSDGALWSDYYVSVYAGPWYDNHPSYNELVVAGVPNAEVNPTYCDPNKQTPFITEDPDDWMEIIPIGGKTSTTAHLNRNACFTSEGKSHNGVFEAGLEAWVVVHNRPSNGGTKEYDLHLPLTIRQIN